MKDRAQIIRSRLVRGDDLHLQHEDGGGSHWFFDDPYFEVMDREAREAIASTGARDMGDSMFGTAAQTYRVPEGALEGS